MAKGIVCLFRLLVVVVKHSTLYFTSTSTSLHIHVVRDNEVSHQQLFSLSICWEMIHMATRKTIKYALGKWFFPRCPHLTCVIVFDTHFGFCTWGEKEVIKANEIRQKYLFIEVRWGAVFCSDSRWVEWVIYSDWFCFTSFEGF